MKRQSAIACSFLISAATLVGLTAVARGQSCTFSTNDENKFFVQGDGCTLPKNFLTAESVAIEIRNLEATLRSELISASSKQTAKVLEGMQKKDAAEEAGKLVSEEAQKQFRPALKAMLKEELGEIIKEMVKAEVAAQTKGKTAEGGTVR